MTNKFDVLVAGAGPAGSTAARLLAKLGLRTLLLEKEEFPRYKPCGGGLTSKVKTVLDLDFSSTIEGTILRLSVAYAGRRRFELDWGSTLGWCVMRDKFDQLLAEHAILAGAEFRDKSPMLDMQIDKDRVKVRTPHGQVEAKVIVGADGANGLVARTVGLQNRKFAVGALETELDVPASSIDTWHGTWHIDYGAISGGYGWIFPKESKLSVGVASFLPGRGKKNLREILDRYIASEPTLRSSRKLILRGHLLPLSRFFGPIHQNRLVLVGDAARVVDPFTGEGIYAAIKTGNIAAAEVTHGFEIGDFAFSNYSMRIKTEFESNYRFAWATNGLFYRLPKLATWALKHSKIFQSAARSSIQKECGYRLNLRWLQMPHV